MSVRRGVTSAVRRQEDIISPAIAWFFILVFICIAGPYMLDVRPRTQRQWRYIAVTIALLAWLLPLMVSLLSAVD